MARVGVEYLPPEDEGSDLSLVLSGRDALVPSGQLPDEEASLPHSLEPLAGFLGVAQTTRVPTPDPERPRSGRAAAEATNSAELVASLDLSRERIAAVEDTSERVALRFLREVLGDDRRHVERTLGSSVQTGQFGLQSPDVPTTYVDHRDYEDQLPRMKRYGTRLLRRPARRALKELSLVSDVEQALDEFKAVHIPLSGAYQEQHNKTHRGRFSMHLGKGSDAADPIEVYYLHSGWKIGSGPDNARVQYSKNLTDQLRLKLRSSYAYGDQDVKVLGTLMFEVSPQTTINLAAGNDMTVLTGPQTYLGTPPEEDRSQAIAFYVEHMF